MKFGPAPLNEAEGAVLAHSLKTANMTIRKGSVLSGADIADLRSEGITSLVVARIEPGDMAEDAAATKIGAALATPGCRLTPAFTGRVNLVSDGPGIVRIDSGAVAAMNAIDEGLTLATLPDLMRVDEGQLIATVKVIPYGVETEMVGAAVIALGSSAVRLSPFNPGRAQLVMTRTAGFKDSLLDKGHRVVADRLAGLGMELDAPVIVDHTETAVAEALDVSADMILILGASATSDRGDVAPAGVVAAGGRIDRFGMPVDPGNLLFLGDLQGVPVVGLPGCARSPAMNGVDWVLERLAAGIPVDGAAIAAMGVGGLLKEMPGRPQPRQPRS